MAKSGYRMLDGTYAREHQAPPRVVHAFNAFGRGVGDKRKVSSSWIGMDLAKDAPTCAECDMANSKDAQVDIAKITTGAKRLTRGRLASAAEAMGGKPKPARDGVDPIIVTPRLDKDGHYVVVRRQGDHRVAALKLSGYAGTVPVRIAQRKGTGGSVDDEKAKWVSAKIKLLIDEGREPDQAAAIAHSMWAREHESKKILTTATSGAGAEFAPPVDGGASPSDRPPYTAPAPASRRTRARARHARRSRRARRMRKDEPASEPSSASSESSASESVEAVLTDELKRRINALATVVAGLGEASDKRVRRAARTVAKELRRAKRMRSVPGPYLRAIQSAQRAVEREFESRGWPYGAVRVSVGMGKFDPDQPRDESGRWSETGSDGAASGTAIAGGPTWSSWPTREATVARLKDESGRSPSTTQPAGSASEDTMTRSLPPDARRIWDGMSKEERDILMSHARARGTEWVVAQWGHLVRQLEEFRSLNS